MATDTDRESPRVWRRVGMVLAYVVAGAVATAGVALAALVVLEPVHPLVYDLYYRRVGPSAATETAILGGALLAGVAGLATSLVGGLAVAGAGSDRRPIGVAVLGLGGVVAVFLAVATVGLAAMLTAVVLVAVAAVGVPVGLWYGADLRSRGMAAFLGGVPVVVALLLIAGVGVGWGWGYVVVAETAPGATAEADFAAAPAVAADLFTASACESTGDGTRRCRLELRGYAHELAAVRFLAEHGVRCPYQGGGESAASVIAVHEGTTYRVTCGAHGD